MIKKLIKNLFKSKVTKEITVLDKISELIKVSIDYKHTNQLDDYISIEYSGYCNCIKIWMWDKGRCFLHEDVDLNLDNAIEELEKMRILLLQLIEVAKLNKEA